HRLRLVLEVGDVLDDLFAEATFGGGPGGIGVGPAELVLAEAVELWPVDQHVRHDYLFSHRWNRYCGRGIPRWSARSLWSRKALRPRSRLHRAANISGTALFPACSILQSPAGEDTESADAASRSREAVD